MASESHPTQNHLEEEEEGDQFIEAGDVLQEVDEGDHPMDEDDDGEAVLQLDYVDGEGVDMDDIVYEDNSIQHFPTHGASVFTIATHPTADIAVSGGEDDNGYIWDINNGETIVKLTGHTDSVTSVGFSADGEYVASGGMDGRVRIWRRVGKENYKNWEFITELQGPDEVMWLRWHPKGLVLLAGSNDSTVWLWQIPSGNTMQVFSGHTGAVQCGDFTPDGKRIVTACGDGTLIVWDPRSPTPEIKLSPTDARFDLRSITSIAVNQSATLAVVGGLTGGVRVVNLTKGTVVGAFDGHDEGDSVEAVKFIDLSGAGAGAATVITGGTDGKACIWDISTMRLRTTLKHDDAITTVLVHPAPKTHLVTTSSSDKTLKTWDARTGTLLREHKGHRAPILSTALAKNGSVVVSAGDDAVCLVFETE